VCFVWFSEQTAIIYLCSINYLVFINVSENVYCAVRAETLKHYNLRLQCQKDKQAKHGNLKLKKVINKICFFSGIGVHCPEKPLHLVFKGLSTCKTNAACHKDDARTFSSLIFR